MSLPDLLTEKRRVAEAAKERNCDIWFGPAPPFKIAAQENCTFIATFDPSTILAMLDVIEAASDDHYFTEYGGHNREGGDPQEECPVCTALTNLEVVMKGECDPSRDA